MGRYLTKSNFVTFCSCPKSLWLQVYKPEIESEMNANAQARIDTGKQVGDLAKHLFGAFTDVTSFNDDGDLDIGTMIKNTEAAIAAGDDVICEASFVNDDNYCAVDILRRNEDGFEIYEVKSSTSYYEERYYQDTAYQKWLLEECGVNVVGTYIIYINNEYVRDGELNLNELFSIEKVDEKIEGLRLQLPELAMCAHRVLDSSEEPKIGINDKCGKPKDCEFWGYCAKHVPSPSVFDLYRMRSSQKFALYNDDKVTFEDLRGEKLTTIQNLQVECTINNVDSIDAVGIRKFLNTLSFPLYFLDFETMQMVVPEYDGTRPYQQLPFQYSLHILDNKDGQLVHREFLGDGVNDPRRALAEQLCKDIPKSVCSLAYNMAFEKKVLSDLADAFPDLSDHLMDIRANMKDLLDPFQKGCYYTPAMGGSFSIKSVLPALFPDDPALDYHNLQGCVHNGAQAMSIYPKLKDMSAEDQENVRNSLLKYCELDTYAMVKVWMKLVETV